MAERSGAQRLLSRLEGIYKRIVIVIVGLWLLALPVIMFVEPSFQPQNFMEKISRESELFQLLASMAYILILVWPLGLYVVPGIIRGVFPVLGTFGNWLLHGNISGRRDEDG